MSPSSSPWVFDSTNHSTQTTSDKRSFLVHIPANYNPDIAHAVVLSFHGFESDSIEQEKISGFSEPGLTINGKVKSSLLLPVCTSDYKLGEHI